MHVDGGCRYPGVPGKPGGDRVSAPHRRPGCHPGPQLHLLAALVPWALLIILSLWIILFALTHYVSVASLAASFTLPFATWFTTKSWTLTIVTAAMGVLAIYKHKANIRRLLKGTENRI